MNCKDTKYLSFIFVKCILLGFNKSIKYSKLIMAITKNIWLKRLFIVLGSLSLILGVIGIVLPLLPTTPFLLLSAYFYSKSSQKFYDMLLNNKIFGKYINDFRQGKGITLKAKIVSLSTLWIMMIISFIFLIKPLFVKVILSIISSIVTYYLISLKTLEE